MWSVFFWIAQLKINIHAHELMFVFVSRLVCEKEEIKGFRNYEHDYEAFAGVVTFS